MQREDRLGKWHRRLAIVGLLAVVTVVAIYSFRGIPGVAAKVMRDATSFELLSLDPERGRDNADFHRFKVLGRTMVSDALTRKRLYNALQSGARWNLPFPAMCFNPRHGLRVTTGGNTVDLVICFECSQVQVWQGNSHVTTFIVGQSPEPVFDQALRDAGVPLAPK
jgi:hypothetical protein